MGQLVTTYRDPEDTNSNVNALLRKFEPFDEVRNYSNLKQL